MRFRAPNRDQVDPETFSHPAFSGFAHCLTLLCGRAWPRIEDLNTLFGPRTHLVSGVPLQFVEQTPAVLADEQHYEERIFKSGLIATRRESWHDLFNALMWLERFELKCAVNASYVREIAKRSAQPRTRAQCALTHFDEGGAIVTLADPELLARWDAHDWHGLFFKERTRWDRATTVQLFGHAMLEQRLAPSTLSVAKCLVVAPTGNTVTALMQAVATEINAQRLLRDPQELRPLPLAVLTNWDSRNADAAFYNEPCFRPVRAGRRYPSIVTFDSSRMTRSLARCQ
jgi:Protein of unknown function (DUF3025)